MSPRTPSSPTASAPTTTLAEIRTLRAIQPFPERPTGVDRVFSDVPDTAFTARELFRLAHGEGDEE